MDTMELYIYKMHSMFVVAFAIECLVAMHIFWLIYKISDADVDGIWLGVLLVFFCSHLFHSVLLIQAIVCRSSQLKITLRARHEVSYHIIQWFVLSLSLFFVCSQTSNKPNEAYNEIGYRIEFVYERKHRKILNA